MNIGLVAHDSKKKLMQNFCIAYRGILSKISDCRQSPRLFAGDFSVLKRLKVSIFKTFQSLFGIIKVSKKAVLFYDDTRNRKSKKANADGMY